MQETEAPSFDEDECPVSRTLGAEPPNEPTAGETNEHRERSREKDDTREREREREHGE